MSVLFSARAFEHLLFALNPRFYAAIEDGLRRIEAVTPGALAGAVALSRLARTRSAKAPIDRRELGSLRLPSHDIKIDIPWTGTGQIRKVTEGRLAVLPHGLWQAQSYPGCHLIVSFTGGAVRRAFMVPLGLILQDGAAQTLAAGTFQIYQHRLFPFAQPVLAARGGGAVATVPVSVLAATGYTYTGLTSRSWTIRFREHRQAAGSGSPLLFHRALRNALFPVAAVEHEVLRAGLTEDEALTVEEAEVEETSLFPLHPRGLNMVPGGRAGLRFLSTWWPQDRPRPRPGQLEEAYAWGIERFLTGGKRDSGGPDGSAISRLWQSDLDYRIRVMTGAAGRLSERQIMAGRIWHAAGWPPEKIVAHLDGIDGRGASPAQVRRLIEGRTYRSIPNTRRDRNRPKSGD